MDKGFKLYVLVLIWMGIMTCLPQIIFDGDYIALTGIISCCIGVAIFILANERKKNAFISNLPVTYLHIAILVSYAFASIFTIAFTDINKNSIKPLSQSILAYIIYPILSFIIESIINNKREQVEPQKTKAKVQTLNINSNIELNKTKIIKTGDRFKTLLFMHTINEDGSRGEIVADTQYEITEVSETHITYKDEEGNEEKKDIKSFKEMSSNTRYFKWMS